MKPHFFLLNMYPHTSFDDSFLVSKIACMHLQLYDSANAVLGTFTAPKNIGDNGYWISDSPKNTDPALAGIAAAVQVKAVSVCLSGSGAITHIDSCLSDY
jgi:hypothetical protein